MSYINEKTSTELWVVTNLKGEVLWTRGGSSTTPKIMAYESKKKAEMASRSLYRRLIYAEGTTMVKMAYHIQRDETTN